jgi:hypothetical protein
MSGLGEEESLFPEDNGPGTGLKRKADSELEDPPSAKRARTSPDALAFDLDASLARLEAEAADPEAKRYGSRQKPPVRYLRDLQEAKLFDELVAREQAADPYEENKIGGASVPPRGLMINISAPYLDPLTHRRLTAKSFFSSNRFSRIKKGELLLLIQGLNATATRAQEQQTLFENALARARALVKDVMWKDIPPLDLEFKRSQLRSELKTAADSYNEMEELRSELRQSMPAVADGQSVMSPDFYWDLVGEATPYEAKALLSRLDEPVVQQHAPRLSSTGEEFAKLESFIKEMAGLEPEAQPSVSDDDDTAMLPQAAAPRVGGQDPEFQHIYDFLDVQLPQGWPQRHEGSPAVQPERKRRHRSHQEVLAGLNLPGNFEVIATGSSPDESEHKMDSSADESSSSSPESSSSSSDEGRRKVMVPTLQSLSTHSYIQPVLDEFKQNLFVNFIRTRVNTLAGLHDQLQAAERRIRDMIPLRNIEIMSDQQLEDWGQKLTPESAQQLQDDLVTYMRQTATMLEVATDLRRSTPVLRTSREDPPRSLLSYDELHEVIDPSESVQLGQQIVTSKYDGGRESKQRREFLNDVNNLGNRLRRFELEYHQNLPMGLRRLKDYVASWKGAIEESKTWLSGRRFEPQIVPEDQETGLEFLY